MVQSGQPCFKVKANFCLEETVSSIGQKRPSLRILVERNRHTLEIKFHNDLARQLKFLEIGDTIVLDSLPVTDESRVTVRRFDHEFQFPLPDGASMPEWTNRPRCGTVLSNLIGVSSVTQLVVGVVFAHIGPFFSFVRNRNGTHVRIYATNVLIVDRSFRHLPPEQWNDVGTPGRMPCFSLCVAGEHRAPLLTMGDTVVGYDMIAQAKKDQYTLLDRYCNILHSTGSILMVKSISDSTWRSISHKPWQSRVVDEHVIRTNALAEWAQNVLANQTCVSAKYRQTLASCEYADHASLDLVVRVELPIANPLQISDGSGTNQHYALYMHSEYGGASSLPGVIAQLNKGDFLRLRNVQKGFGGLSVDVRYITKLPRWSFDVKTLGSKIQQHQQTQARQPEQPQQSSRQPEQLAQPQQSAQSVQPQQPAQLAHPKQPAQLAQPQQPAQSTQQQQPAEPQQSSRLRPKQQQGHPTQPTQPAETLQSAQPLQPAHLSRLQPAQSLRLQSEQSAQLQQQHQLEQQPHHPPEQHPKQPQHPVEQHPKQPHPQKITHVLPLPILPKKRIRSRKSCSTRMVPTPRVASLQFSSTPGPLPTHTLKYISHFMGKLSCAIENVYVHRVFAAEVRSIWCSACEHAFCSSSDFFHYHRDFPKQHEFENTACAFLALNLRDAESEIVAFYESPISPWGDHPWDAGKASAAHGLKGSAGSLVLRAPIEPFSITGEKHYRSGVRIVNMVIFE